MSDRIKAIRIELVFKTEQMTSNSKSSSLIPGTYQHSPERIKQTILGGIRDLSRLATMEGYGDEATASAQEAVAAFKKFSEAP